MHSESTGSAMHYVGRFFSRALVLYDFPVPSHAAAISDPGWPVAMHAPNQPLRWNSDHADHDHACMYWILWVTEWKFMHAWSGCWLFEIDTCILGILVVWKCQHSAPARDLLQLWTTEMDSFANFVSRKVVASYFLHNFWPTLLGLAAPYSRFTSDCNLKFTADSLSTTFFFYCLASICQSSLFFMFRL